MPHATTPHLPTMAQPPVNPLRLGVLVLLVAIVGAVLVLRFAGDQEKRDLIQWQSKLNLIADSRANDIGGWVEHHFKELGDVAGNPSLQLYVTMLESAKPDTAATTATKTDPLTPALPGAQMAPTAADEPAQAVYLRNLLLVTADKLGFAPKSDPLKDIHANVKRATGSGLALVDAGGHIIAATGGMASLDATLAARVAQAPKGRGSLIDLFTSVGGELDIGFVLPIYAIQSDPGASSQIATLVGVKPLGGDFYKLLSQPGVTDKTLEALIVRRSGDKVEFLANSGSDRNLSGSFNLSTPPDLDAAYAITAPGDFAIKRDRSGHLVLMTSRAINGTPWQLLLHIDRDQALAESDSWRMKTETIMFFAVLAMIAGIVAAWWYGTSRRAMLLSEQTGKLAAHSMAQETMLRLVTDNQPEPIFIADGGNIVRFANEKTGTLFTIAPGDVTNKSLTALMGPLAAAGYIEANAQALSGNKTILRTHTLGAKADARILRSEHIPLAHIPLDTLPYPSPGVLIIDQDISEIVHEREARALTLKQVIATLVRMVDERDPNASNHSAGVALVAREVARDLGLEPRMIETAETAGNLMNIGKIVVPSAILIKKAALDSDEILAIRESLQRSADLLQNIDFDGPVVETLHQAGEKYDGSGPLGLKGDAILITARIIAAANSFIGMISPRSYRAANSVEQATSLLLRNIDTQLDRRVVVALINFIENKKGKEQLLALANKKGGKEA